MASGLSGLSKCLEQKPEKRTIWTQLTLESQRRRRRGCHLSQPSTTENVQPRLQVVLSQRYTRTWTSTPDSDCSGTHQVDLNQHPSSRISAQEQIEGDLVDKQL